VTENITSRKSLIPDPYYSGERYHEIGKGGYSSIHTDFYRHKLMNLEQRINVLIYLDKSRQDIFGG
jgi:hypothetical protein